MADFEVPSVGGPGLIPGLGMIPHATTKSSHAAAKDRHVQRPRPSAAKKKKDVHASLRNTLLLKEMLAVI